MRNRRGFAIAILALSTVVHIVILTSAGIVETYPEPPKWSEKEIVGWEIGVSRNITKYLDPVTDTTIISGQKVCANQATELVIIIPIQPEKFRDRTYIRDTFSLYNANCFAVGFLVGLASSQDIQASLEEENETFQDIIQENLTDTYNNLTLKSIAILKWYIQKCPNSSLLMKADVDTFVDVDKLLYEIHGYNGAILMGLVYKRAVVIREALAKWYAPKYMFKEQYYPDYLCGSGYVISKDVAIKLYAAALDTPIFHLEDVYITGICAQKARVVPKSFPGIFYRGSHDKILRECLPHHTTCNPVKPDEMLKILTQRRGIASGH